ncbi:DNA/RNA nuclease SfsA [Oceanisphaera avium]|uniref:Sugar fermentation stimulation protein homolog n=1 Tax=Oceanisphaera avium TaxID=1903694 RepID=A0A1Y0D223_9GAMM|nr:DNA/RNA nuclease SfsA [Oceanisphaera avium]ART81155.1 sugar fermentation stimulation protein SfsA [Oceanisphaera avium]
MAFSPSLQKGQLLRRYKRFLADVQVQDQTLTLHCPNTGKMTGCAEPGWPVYFSESNNRKRKYPHTWELVENEQGDFVCVNTQQANALVASALAEQRITPLSAYQDMKAEVRYGTEQSRIDFLLSACSLPDCYVEVKSVTLLAEEHSPGQGYFPDTKSERAQKHVRELMQCVRDGHRAVLLFCVLHTGITRVSPAAHIDPDYAALVEKAMALGVECLAWRATINPQGMQLIAPVPFSLAPDLVLS